MVTDMVTAAFGPASAPVPEATVWAALADVADPEIPAVSVVDLGIVHRVETAPGRIRVEILPTFVGCPAVEMIRAAIVDRLALLVDAVEVVVSFAVPWTSDRITPEGRRRLRSSGFAPPAPTAEPVDVRCPFCDSPRTVLDSAFGPTLCRALYYCRDCRQPFEQFKAV
jgi:ring-1,2-phenylacetyl-CoA epoxidase subunit PaaD